MREFTSFDHFAIAEEIRKNAPTFFQKFSLIEGGYKVKLRGFDLLVVFPDKVFISSHTVQASPPDSFSQKVRKELRGKKLLDAKTLNLDRILLLDFGDRKLVFELFREGNVVLLDEEGVVLAVLRPGSWRHRELRVGVMYKTPPAPPISRGEILSDSFLIRDLVRSGIPKPYAHEVIYRLGLEEKQETSTLDTSAILKTVEEILEELKHPGGYICGGEPFPIPLGYLGCKKVFESFSEAVDSFIEEILSVKAQKRDKQKKSKLEYMEESLREIDAEIRALEELINYVYEHWSELEEQLRKREFRDIGRLRFKGVKGKEAVFDFTP